MIRKISLYIIIILVTMSCNDKINVSIMTYNVRYGLANDGTNSWDYRKGHLAKLIQSKKTDFLGTQEGLPFQIEYILNAMPSYKFIGKDRDNNGKGENTAIFYNTEKYVVLENQTFWLAKNQNKVSKSWDAAYPRICTYGLFQEIKSERKFWVINTHFDHKGEKARVESAKIIINKIKEINEAHNYPVIFMGDLNATPSTEEITILKTVLKDTKELSKTKPTGPIGTFNNFEFYKPVTKLIDYIFVNNNKSILINKHAVLDDSKESKYPSDHLPVYIELTF
ncbi:MAG: endonuclease/exonuclease/phosphatase family protein [Flavobacteriaceae bacterium]